MIEADLIKLISGSVLFVLSLIITWVKTGASVREKITRKRNEQNAKSSVQAKDRLINDSTRSIDDKFNELHDYDPR